ncbi:MAG: SurA N-terminal domain-containing protein [Elusimicrobiota bacterium]
MGRFIRKYKEILLVVILVMFMLSLFVGFGSVVMSGKDVIAKVGKRKIGRKPFEMNYRQTIEAIRSNNPEADITADMEKGLRQEVLRELIIREFFLMEAQKWGLKVSPPEVARDIAMQPLFTNKEGQFDPRTYYQFVVRTLGVLPKEFEAERERDILNLKFRNILAQSIPLIPSQMQWTYALQHAKDGKQLAELSEDQRKQVMQNIGQQASLDLLNMFLTQLSQRYPVQTFLDNES